MSGLGRKAALGLGGDLSSAALSMVAMYFVAHRLGPDVLGTVGSLLGLLGLLGLVADLGIHQAYVKRAAEDAREAGGYLGAFLVLKGVLIPFLVAAVAVLPRLDPRLAARLADPELRWAYALVGLYYLGGTAVAVPSLTLTARRETARLTVVTVSATVVSNLAKIAVALGHGGPAALAAAFALQTVVGTAVGGLMLWRSPLRRPSRAHLVRLVAYAAPVCAVTAIAYVTQNVDRVLLERWSGTREVGFYAAVGGLVALLQRFPLAGTTLFLPQASEDVHRGALHVVSERLVTLERYGLLATVPLAAALAGCADLIVGLYLGRAFEPSASVLAVLALAPVLLALFEPYNMVVYAVEHHRHLVGVSALGLVAMLGTTVVLVPRELAGWPLAGLGAVGTALSILAMQATTGICQVRLAVRAARVRVYWRGGWYLGAGAAMYGVVAVVRGSLPPGLPGVLTGVAAGLVVFVGVLVGARQVARADLRRLGDTLSPARMAAYIASELRR